MMRRGQAFETMMLVISVIVALVILGVLIGIIRNLPGLGTGDVDSLMHDELKKIVASGYGCSAPTKTLIKRGSNIFAKQIKGDIVSVSDSDEFKFLIASGEFGAGLTAAPNALVKDAKLSAASLTSPEAQIFFVVCGDTLASPAKFRVCLATRDNDPKIAACSPTAS